MNRSDCSRPEGTCRPGGLILTNRALDFAGFGRGVKLLDIGCGQGITVRHLRATRPCAVFGMDRNPDAVKGRDGLVCADAERIPFSAGAVDGVLLECCLSVMVDPNAVLAECRRVLKPGGRVLMSDLYARGDSACLRLGGLIGRVDTRGTLTERWERHEFAVDLFEDHSECLRALWGQIVFDKGAAASRADLGTDAATLRAAKCGYCLIVARRKEGR